MEMISPAIPDRFSCQKGVKRRDLSAGNPVDDRGVPEAMIGINPPFRINGVKNDEGIEADDQQDNSMDTLIEEDEIDQK
jgi:hypothetical protein